jgi:hypothetical protein
VNQAQIQSAEPVKPKLSRREELLAWQAQREYVSIMSIPFNFISPVNIPFHHLHEDRFRSKPQTDKLYTFFFSLNDFHKALKNLMQSEKMN